MRKFDDFMEKNRGEFDLIEPRADLWDKIEARLDARKKRHSYSILWKAAAVAVLFALSFWAQKQKDQAPEGISYAKSEKKENMEQLSESKDIPVIARHIDKVMPEFAETESYYNRKVKDSMKELKVYLVKYPDVARDMKKDLAELDSVYLSLKKDLGDNVAHEEIINAMIQNYRMKLQILEEIKETLEQNSNGTINKNKSQETHVL